MKRPPVLWLPAVLGCGLIALFAAGCGSSESGPAGAKVLSFELTDQGCNPHDATAPAGPITFEVKGASGSVTELEVLEGETILGERENITEGLEGSFSLTLEEGEYTLRCNGGTEEDGTLRVTGGNGAQYVEAVAALAVKFGLMGSVGSDFHNPQLTWNPLGRSLKLPDCVTPVWRSYIPQAATP